MTMFGIAPGKDVGDVLDHLLEKVLDDPALNTKDDLKRLAHEYFKNNKHKNSDEESDE